MKTTAEIRTVLDGCRYVDVHIHTHLCDGQPEMTVENIAAKAREQGIGAIVLTPHWHKQVSDETETLYEDSEVGMLLALRQEIDALQRKDDAVKVLLSTETDILSVDGSLSLELTPEIEDAVDLITPTMNYNPILPLCCVHLTYGKDVNGMHESGEYQRMADKAGGIPAVLEAMYEAEANAILRAPYPCMLGHFLAAHSLHPDKYSWFGAGEEHLPIMKAGVDKVIAACAEKNAMIDLTGVHMKGQTAREKADSNGFWFAFQQYVVETCRKHGVAAYPGSDSHRLKKIGTNLVYYDLLFKSV